MQVSTNFILQEFVYPVLYKKWGNKAIYWVAQRRIDTAQLLRDLANQPVTINDWHKPGGSYSMSGLRPFNTKAGSSLSQHKYNSADDFKIGEMSSQEMYYLILQNWEQFRAVGVTTIEDPEKTVGKHRDWLHVDGRNVQGIWDLDDGPYIVVP